MLVTDAQVQCKNTNESQTITSNTFQIRYYDCTNTAGSYNLPAKVYEYELDYNAVEISLVKFVQDLTGCPFAAPAVDA